MKILDALSIEPEISEPVLDRVAISNQPVSGNGILLDQLVVSQDRWLILYQIKPNGPKIVSRYFVAAGTYTNARILLQQEVPHGAVLGALLHEDTGAARVFDFPVYDPPVGEDGTSFVLGTPSIRVKEQSGEAVTLDSIIAVAPSWVMIYDGIQERILGVQEVPIGISTLLTVPIDNLPLGQPRELMAVLYYDNGRPSEFEILGPDQPVYNADGTIVQSLFSFTLISPDKLTSQMYIPPARSQSLAPSTPSTPVLFSPPDLFSPENLAPHDQDRITFQWRWEGTLAENWGFEVRGWLPEQNHNGIHDARITGGIGPNEFGVYSLNLRVPEQFRGKIWYWTVAVVQLEPYERIGPEAPPNIVVVP